MKVDVEAHVHPGVSIEVDDVDEIHRRAAAAGAEIDDRSPTRTLACAGPFVRDPNGDVINGTQQR